MSFNYPGNASLVGPGLQSSRVGVHSLDYGLINPPSIAFPITNANLQWNFDMTANGTTANTSYSSSAILTTTPIVSEHTSWKHSSASNATAFSYNKAGGQTGLYLELPKGCNLTTVDGSGNSINSYDGTTIRNNFGYTIWTCTYATTPVYSEFFRLLMYAGTGGNNTSSDVASQSNQYSNIIVFNYTTANTAQVGYGSELRFGTAPGQSGSSSYQKHAQGTGVFSDGHVMISVWVFNPATWDVATTNASVRSKTGVYSVTNSSWYVSPTTALGDSYDYAIAAGVRSGTTGKPWIADNQYYTTSGTIKLIAAGFANRPYSSADVSSIFTWLAAKHLNVVA